MCVDQTNPLERNHRVAQMRGIYRSASRVVTWLGAKEAMNRFLETTRAFYEQVTEVDNTDSMEQIHRIWNSFRVADEIQLVYDCA